MTLPKGYKQPSPGQPPKKPSNRGKIIGAIIVIFIVIIIIAAFAYAWNHDNAVIQEAFDYGCVPLTDSFSGKPTSWSCPAGTPEHVGRY